VSWGVLPDGRTALSSLLDPLLESSFHPLWSLLCSTTLESSLLNPLLESSSLSQSQSESLVPDSQSVSRSVGQTVHLGLESLLICVRVPAVSVSKLCPILSVR
jgi:hypothetical protein